jgi:hypothetical protein
VRQQAVEPDSDADRAQRVHQRQDEEVLPEDVVPEGDDRDDQCERRRDRCHEDERSMRPPGHRSE